MTDTTLLNENVKKRIITHFVPTMRADDLRTVDWSLLKNSGIALIAIDLDNTLASHGSDTPDDYASEAVDLMRKAGLSVMLYSNAAYDRDKRFASGLSIEAIENVKKPRADALETVLQKYDLNRDEVLVVGDQLITDVWSANRLGVRSIWVKKRDSQELLTIRLKRIAERLMAVIWPKTFKKIPEAPQTPLSARLQMFD